MPIYLSAVCDQHFCDLEPCINHHVSEQLKHNASMKNQVLHSSISGSIAFDSLLLPKAKKKVWKKVMKLNLPLPKPLKKLLPWLEPRHNFYFLQ